MWLIMRVVTYLIRQCTRNFTTATRTRGRGHRSLLAVDQPDQDLGGARGQRRCHVGPVCRQCRVGFVVDTEFGIRRRTRVQDNNAAWISRSQISVNSRMWRRVCAMSSADAGFVGSRATSETPRNKPPASASASRARRARSGSARPCSFPNIPSMNPITSSRRIAAIFARPSRVSGASMRIIRNGAFLFWCRASLFHRPIRRTRSSSFKASRLSIAGSSPPHRPATVSIGEAVMSGEAILPRSRVRTT